MRPSEHIGLDYQAHQKLTKQLRDIHGVAVNSSASQLLACSFGLGLVLD